MAVLPLGDNHTAGGGVYYHVDCTYLLERSIVLITVADGGDPRDYKWINTISLAKSSFMTLNKSARMDSYR